MRARRPDLGEALDALMRDHSMIAHLVGALEHALSAGVDAEQAHRQLDGIEAVMEAHVRYEERVLGEALEALTLTSDPSTALGPLG